MKMKEVRKQYQEVDVEKLEKKLSDVVRQIYEAGEIRFTPKYPWVLVRVLPKAQESLGGIWLPQNQNKVMYEGIVLATWRPFDAEQKWNEETNAYDVVRRFSQLQVGQRIGFPHYEGLPIRHFDEQKYRLVREEVNLKDNPNCGVLGWVEYDGDRKLKDELDRLLEGASMVTVSGE